MLEKIINDTEIIYRFLKDIFVEESYSFGDVDLLQEDEIKHYLEYYRNTHFYDLFNLYFHPEIHNLEHLPEGGALLVGNHTTPGWDALSVFQEIYQQVGRIVYSLVFKGMTSKDWLSGLKAFGAVEGNKRLAKDLLVDDRLVQVYPGGIEDALRPFWKMDLVPKIGGFKDDRLGYIKTAYEAGKPLVPMGITGANKANMTLCHVQDIVHPVMRKISESGLNNNWIKKFTRSILDVKVIPVPLNLIPFPAKIDIYLTEPIPVEDPNRFREINDEVMYRLQKILDYGQY